MALVVAPLVLALVVAPLVLALVVALVPSRGVHGALRLRVELKCLSR